MCRRSGRGVRKSGNTAIRPAGFPGGRAAIRDWISRIPQPSGRPQAHTRMMPGKRSKWNLDPSRAIVFDDGGRPVAGHDDRVGLRGFPDAAGWPQGVAGAGRRHGTPGCNSVVRGRSGGKARILRDIPAGGKLVAEELLRRDLSSALASRARQRRRFRVRLDSDLGWSPDKGLPLRNPAVGSGGVPVLTRLQSQNIPPANPDDWSDDSRLRRG